MWGKCNLFDKLLPNEVLPAPMNPTRTINFFFKGNVRGVKFQKKLYILIILFNIIIIYHEIITNSIKNDFKEIYSFFIYNNIWRKPNIFYILGSSCAQQADRKKYRY